MGRGYLAYTDVLEVAWVPAIDRGPFSKGMMGRIVSKHPERFSA